MIELFKMQIKCMQKNLLAIIVKKNFQINNLPKSLHFSLCWTWFLGKGYGKKKNIDRIFAQNLFPSTTGFYFTYTPTWLVQVDISFPV